MILKWLFTFLAVMWLFRMLRQMLQPPPGRRYDDAPPRGQKPPRPEGTVEIQRREDDDDADFADYEELKP